MRAHTHLRIVSKHTICRLTWACDAMHAWTTAPERQTERAKKRGEKKDVFFVSLQRDSAAAAASVGVQQRYIWVTVSQADSDSVGENEDVKVGDAACRRRQQSAVRSVRKWERRRRKRWKCRFFFFCPFGRNDLTGGWNIFRVQVS